MLRITISDEPAEQRWILQGELVMPWVAELETNWNERGRCEAQRCVVDLSEVRRIDSRGEQTLQTMKEDGAEFVDGGVYVRHIVERINSGQGREAEAARRHRNVADEETTVCAAARLGRTP